MPTGHIDEQQRLRDIRDIGLLGIGHHTIDRTVPLEQPLANLLRGLGVAEDRLGEEHVGTPDSAKRIRGIGGVLIDSGGAGRIEHGDDGAPDARERDDGMSPHFPTHRFRAEVARVATRPVGDLQGTAARFT
jgi:hypothetical protein